MILVSDKKDFKEWIWGKFIEWRGDTINGPTAFARYLDIQQQLVSDWMAGKYRPRSSAHIKKLADKYPEVYDVLGLQNPNEPDPFDNVPQPYREPLKAAIQEIETTLNKKKINPDSPEGQEIAREIFLRLGFDVRSIEIHDD